MVFTLKDIREIAGETIMGIVPECRGVLVRDARDWANDNVHRFIALDGDTVHFDRLGFDYAVIDKVQDIAAGKHFPTI